MRNASGVSWTWAVGALVLLLVAPAWAQDPRANLGTPNQRGAAVPWRVTLDLDDVPLGDALKAVAAQGRVSLVYSSSTLPLNKRVSAHPRGATVREALNELLHGTNVEARETASGQVILVRRATREMPLVPEPPTLASINGRVIDSTTHAPVPSALVTLDEGIRRATSNDAGQFLFADVVVGTHTVHVRRIGYAPAMRTVDVPASGSMAVDLALVPVASQLDEVVTTVTGPQRRLEVGNVIGVINADSLVKEAPVATLTDVLNARVAGVQVVQNSGLSGQSPRVRIRGLNSAALSNDPLLIVDGARAENSTGSVVSGYGQRGGRLNDLNPDEIESIEVVKGPSAATLYGTDAANGVIVVRTKRGRPGPATWSAHMEGGISQQPRALDSYYSWGRSAATGAIQQCLLLQVAAGQCVIDSLTTFNPLNDAATTPLGRGTQQEYGLQVAGGADRFTYFLSGGYQQEVGFLRMPDAEQDRIKTERGVASLPDEQIRPNGLQKINLRANAMASNGGTSDASLAIGYVASDARIPGTDIFQAGYWGRGYRDATDGWSGFVGRPGELFAVRSRENTTRYTASLNSNWRPRDWLSTRATVGTDFSSNFFDALQRRNEGPLGTNRNGRRLNSRADIMLYSADLGGSALYAPYEGSSLRTSVGAQLNRRKLAGTTASATTLPPGSETVTGAATLSSAEQNVESVVAGAYVEETLNWRDRLFITGAMRADGGSAFGQDFRTAFYPKASVSWLVSDRSTGLVQSARLRAAYGASGVQPGPTAALPLVTLAGALVNGTSTTGAVLSAIGNPHLKPERQAEFEVGIDAELLGRLRMEATFYDRLSNDALVNQPLPASVGVPSRQENVGSVRNRGVETLLNVRLVDRSRTSWDVNLNGSWNRNRVERLTTTGLPRPLTPSPTGIAQDYPLFGRFDRPILGFSDTNGNGVIESSEVQVGDSIVYLGSSIPTRQITFGSTLSFLDGRLRISTQFDYRGGFTGSRIGEVNRCTFFNNCRAVNDPSTPLGDQARAVAASFRNTLAGYLDEDASFTRWRELSVTYVAPAVIAQAVRAKSASVTLAGRNIGLFTRYQGVDPEVNSAAGGLEGYGENATAPQSRYWTVRFNLGL
ncbi:MAG TPA: SusC/RagA family TonB-linked outer membrane protein [Gemmatimonadaceae bacterium]